AVLSKAASEPSTTEGKVRAAGLVPGPGLRLEAVMRRMLIATAVAAAMCLNPGPSQAYEGPWCALTDIGGGGHAREWARANLRDVRAGGDCGQPRLLQSGPALAGPRRGAGRPGPGESASIIDGRRRTPANESAAAEIVRGWAPCRNK